MQGGNWRTASRNNWILKYKIKPRGKGHWVGIKTCGLWFEK